MSQEKKEINNILPNETALATREKDDEGPEYLKKALKDLTWQDAQQWLKDLADGKLITINHTEQNYSWTKVVFFLIERGQVGNYKEITPDLNLVHLKFPHVRKFVYAPFKWKETIAIAIEIHNDHQLSKWYKQVQETHDQELEEKRKAEEARKKREEEKKSAEQIAKELRIQIINSTLTKISKKTDDFN